MGIQKYAKRRSVEELLADAQEQVLALQKKQARTSALSRAPIHRFHKEMEIESSELKELKQGISGSNPAMRLDNRIIRTTLKLESLLAEMAYAKVLVLQGGDSLTQKEEILQKACEMAVLQGMDTDDESLETFLMNSIQNLPQIVESDELRILRETYEKARDAYKESSGNVQKSGNVNPIDPMTGKPRRGRPRLSDNQEEEEVTD